MPIYGSPDTIRALGGAGFKYCESRSLWKDKFVLFDDDFDEAKRVALDLYVNGGRADIKNLRDDPKGWTETKNAQETKRQKALANNSFFNPKQLHNATAALAGTAPFTQSAPKPIAHSRNWLAALPTDRSTTFKLRTTSRLMVGLANGVLENAGCTLHPLFGFPVIPGSALKGIARDAAAVLGKQAEIQSLFGGTPGNDANMRQGDVSFVDAYALLTPNQADLELDIVTPHFQKYYGGTGNPNALDEEPPIPSVFPAVCVGVTFEFALIVHPTRLNNQQAKQALEVTKECLVYGLTHFGIGAKTASGYGRFGALEAASQSIRQDLFPPPPKPVLSAEEEVLAEWKGKLANTFLLRNLIKDLTRIEGDEQLADVFDMVMPAEHLANFRTANSYWTTFLRDGGKAILDRINRQLPRQ